MSGDWGIPNDFLNKVSNRFEATEKSTPIDISNDIGTASDSLQAFDLSAKQDDDQKSMLTLIHDNHSIRSDKDLHRKMMSQIAAPVTAAEIDGSDADRDRE
jgi:hypothetical protein